jgi:hypothetical protein
MRYIVVLFFVPGICGVWSKPDIAPWSKMATTPVFPELKWLAAASPNLSGVIPSLFN